MLTKKIAAAVAICLMVATMAVPSVVGENGAAEAEFDLERLPPGGPITNAESVEWTAWASGLLWVKVKGNGVSSVTVEIYDVSDGGEILLLAEKLGFGPDKYATLESSSVGVSEGLTYKVVGIPGGKPGSTAIVTLMFSPALENEPPVASISAPSSAFADEMVTFDGSGSYDLDGMIVSWSWDFGDGNTASGEIVAHSYLLEGTYTVTLTVTDDASATDSASIDIAIEDSAERRVTFEIRDWFVSDLKESTPEMMGRHGSTPGWNSWWDEREAGYGDTPIRDEWPFIMAANPYASYMSAAVIPDVDIGYYMYAFYRVHLTAKYIDTMSTAAGKDAVFIPVLEDLGGDPNIDGGTVEFSWYGTYMTSADLEALKTGTYWVCSYYDVKKKTLSGDDGYIYELHGILTFDRQAAAKFLGLTGAGSLIDQFEVNKEDIMYDWFLAWDDDANGRYDVWTGYEDVYYDMWTGMKVDPSSTPDKLVVRMWHASWGDEVLMVRYLEAAGIWPDWQVYWENCYMNGTIGPEYGHLMMRFDGGFHLQAWADGDDAAWMLEPIHMDYVPNRWKHTQYESPFNPYNPTNSDPGSTDALRMSYVPGTVHFGQGVSYWVTPRVLNLDHRETLILRLPEQQVIGFTPYVGTSDALTSAKVAELNAASFWGTMTLGTCAPDLSSYYDPVTRTLIIAGPVTFDPILNPMDANLLYHGVPMIILKVVPG